MSFSGKQQGIFRPMVAKAWVWHCQAEGLGAAAAIAGKKHPAYDAWYQHELEEATGLRSSAACNTWRDFNFAMAHFEVLARDGIYWQTELHQCDAKRILWNVNRLAGKHKISEGYLRDWARNLRRKKQRAAGMDEEALPGLLELDGDDLANLLREVKTYVREMRVRGAMPGVPMSPPEPEHGGFHRVRHGQVDPAVVPF